MAPIGEIQRSVGRIEGKLDTFIEQMKVQDNRTSELEVRLVKRDDDKEKRLRSLEKWRWAHSVSGVAILALLAKLGIPTPGGH